MLQLWIIYFLCACFDSWFFDTAHSINILTRHSKAGLGPSLAKKKVSESNAKHWPVSTVAKVVGKNLRGPTRNPGPGGKSFGLMTAMHPSWDAGVTQHTARQEGTPEQRPASSLSPQFDTQLLPAVRPARPASHENSREAQMQAPGKHSKRSHLTPSNGSCTDAGHSTPGASTVQSTLFI